MNPSKPPETVPEQPTRGATPHPHDGRVTVTPKPEKYLRLSDVESLTGLKKSSIYAGMKAGTFPPSIRLSARAVAWPESRIATWQAQREQAGGAQ